MSSRIARAIPYATRPLAWEVIFVARAAAQVTGVPSGDLFGPLTKLFNEAAVSLSARLVSRTRRPPCLLRAR